MFGEEIKPGQVWMHIRKKTRYFVTEIRNEGNSVGDDNNPPIVNYMDGKGNRWSRLILKWHDSFALQGEL